MLREIEAEEAAEAAEAGKEREEEEGEGEGEEEEQATGQQKEETSWCLFGIGLLYAYVVCVCAPVCVYVVRLSSIAWLCRVCHADAALCGDIRLVSSSAHPPIAHVHVLCVCCVSVFCLYVFG